MVYNDVIMADRDFNIAETLGTLGAKLEIPSFTKGQDQMRAEDVEDTRVIESMLNELLVISERNIQYLMELCQ